MYPELFSIKDNKLYISDILTPEILEYAFQLGRIDLPNEDPIEIFEDFNFVNSNIKNAFFSAYSIYYDWLKILEITKFEKLYDKFCNIEKGIEESYSNCLDQIIPLQLLVRLSYIKSFYENHRPMLKYNNYIVHKEEHKTEVIDSNYDEYNNSWYKKNGEEYPIDYDIYKKSNFYEDMSSIRNIQNLLEENYQYAIFGDNSLYEFKVEDYLDQVVDLMPSQFELQNDENIDFEELDYSIDEEYEDDINKYTISLGVIEEEFAFYTIYLHKLNEMIAEGHTELIKPRQRLLYMLDDTSFNLINPKNLEKWYNWACCYGVDEDTYEDLRCEACYFIQDVFEGKDNKTIEKLLFASTYYDMTKDEALLEVLEKYKKYDNYAFYSNIILGETKGYSKIKKS